MRRLTICPILAVLAAASAIPVAARPITLPSVEVYKVRLERDVERSATVVEPHSDGYVYLVNLEGRDEYVPDYRIRAILDAQGTDLTRDVMGHRRRLGPPRDRLPRLGPERQQRGPQPWKPFRFRGGPGSVCGSYAITEFALLWRIGDQGRAGNEEQKYWSIDLGYAKNVGQKNSVGLTGFFGADGVRVQTGVRLRLRQWLTDGWSLDLSPAVVLAANEEGNSHFVGPDFAGQVGLSLGDRFGFTGQVFSIRREYRGDVDHETAWHAGIKLGSEPGLAASAVFLFVAMIYEMNHQTIAVGF